MSAKRANIFGQGRPETPYEEHDESDTPQRATAAQLAQRKIKTAKLRRPAGSSSKASTGAGFGAPQSFNFGPSAPAPAPSTNGMNFGGSNNAFGGGANNSFPPAQSSAPSDSFASSSFPAFGASSQGTGFNPQPPSTSFNFTAGAANPFATTNGAAQTSSAPSSSGFVGGAIFSSQAPSNPFAGILQGNTTSSAGSGGMFGTISSAPSSNMFDAATSNASTTSASAPATTPFTFGAPSATAQSGASTPATSGIFSSFGASAQTAPAPASSNMFGGLGGNAQKNESAPESTTDVPSLFSNNTSGQGTAAATSAAPASSLFNFGSNAQKNESTPSAPPSTNMFGSSGAATPTSTAASNPFASLPTAATSTPAPAFNFVQSTPQAQEKAPSNPFSALKLPETNAETPKTSLFSSIKAPQQATPATSEAPKPNPFAALAKPPPAANTPTFSFGDKTATTSDTSSNTTASKAPEAPKSGLFSRFSTPQPAKKAEAEKPQAGLFSAQPKSSSGIFSQTFQPENNVTGNAFKAPSTFAPQKTQSAPSADSTAKQAPSTEASNPFAKLPTPSTQRPNLFAPSKETAPIPAPSSMPTLTGASGPSSDAPELPKIPKAHVPKEWITASPAAPPKADGLYDIIRNLTTQLESLNDKYRAKINSASLTADWASLSQWHYHHSSALKQKIDAAKKQRAAAKGITGYESSLSTKRKVNDESPDDRHASPSKRARPADSLASPTPQPLNPAPKFNPPPPTATSNLFAKAINSQPSAPAESSNMSSSKSTGSAGSEASKAAASLTGFKPSVPASNGSSTSSSLFSGGFKPSTTTASSSSGGFKPISSGSGGGGFASQFAAKAKSYEELAAERKKKAKDEDYDSDDETEAEWSARYDKEEADRLAKEKADAAAVTGFSLPASAKTSGASTPATNPFASLAKPATGASTPTNGLFTPQPASPALSTTGSVFNAPSTARPASPNIFGHLSSGPSSNNQDESDEDAERPIGSVEPTTPKRKLGDTDTEADEDDEASRKKQATGSKGSLLSRMTRASDEGSESEKENKSVASIFSQSNGTNTPTNKPFSFFNFEAAGAKTAPPKSDTFGGDQTFKPGTPIKFGEGPATEKKADKATPTFSFQPASNSTTPSKPPTTSLFNFGSTSGGSSLLTPAGGLSGLNSAPSSVFSSRAATPLSEADTSAQSAAEDDDEGGKQEQVDLAKLTEEELAANDIVFETDAALAKHQVDKGDGTKTWENFARGPLWILKDKVTGKCFVRIRIASGATPLNYNILPALKTQITGSSGKMVQTTMPKKEGGITQVYISVKTPEIAKEFSTKYNESLPS